MKNTLAIALGLLAAAAFAQSPSGSVEMARKMALGWNLGNQLDAYENGVAQETAWGNSPATQALMDSVAAAGFSAVRIPVTWLGHVGDAPGYEIDRAWLDRVAQVVDYAGKAGLIAIVNIHHDGADGRHWLDIKGAAADEAVNSEIKKRISAMWKQIARRFADDDRVIIFEGFNEIHDGGWGWGNNRKDGGRQYEVLNEWNQTFVDAVRSTGGHNADRFLGIPGYVTNPALTVEHLKLPRDTAADRLLVAVHFYDPNEFAINAKYTEWGKDADAGKKAPWGDEDNVDKTFDSLVETFIDKNRGVYVGEFGATTRANEHDERFRRYYLDYVCRAAASRGIALIFWDNGSRATGHEAFGLFDHSTGAYISPAARAAVGTMTEAYQKARH